MWCKYFPLHKINQLLISETLVVFSWYCFAAIPKSKTPKKSGELRTVRKPDMANNSITDRQNPNKKLYLYILEKNCIYIYKIKFIYVVC